MGLCWKVVSLKGLLWPNGPYQFGGLLAASCFPDCICLDPEYPNMKYLWLIVFGGVNMVWGICFIFGYLDPYGDNQLQ